MKRQVIIEFFTTHLFLILLPFCCLCFLFGFVFFCCAVGWLDLFLHGISVTLFARGSSRVCGDDDGNGGD